MDKYGGVSAGLGSMERCGVTKGRAAVLADPGAVEVVLASGAPAETLVPADLSGLGLAGRTLRSFASVLETAGHALSRVEVTRWRGPASTAFAEGIGPEPARWQAAAEGFRSGAQAMDRYGEDVVSARSLAVEAATVYRRYLASAEAVVDSMAGDGAPPVSGAMAVGMRVSALQGAVASAAASGDATRALQVSTAAGVADGLRRQALDLMDRASSQVAGAGDVAAQAVRTACADAPEARRFWDSTIRPADAIGAGHSVLDAIGLVPLVGDIADGANALWYLGEGDSTNAGLSAVGLVPIIGEAVILEKFGRKILVRDGVLTGGRAAADILAGHTMLRLADGGLVGHELGDHFHTIARHVGRTDAQMAERLAKDLTMKRASTFANLADAERYTYSNLALHHDEIVAFLNSKRKMLEIRQSFDHPVGRTLLRESTGFVDATNVVTRLEKDLTMPHGYRIVTSFPDVA